MNAKEARDATIHNINKVYLIEIMTSVERCEFYCEIFRDIPDFSRQYLINLGYTLEDGAWYDENTRRIKVKINWE